MMWRPLGWESKPRTTPMNVPGGTSPGIPNSNGAIRGSIEDIPPVRRVSKRLHRQSVSLERIANWSTTLVIPDSNSAVLRSGGDIPPIGRVSHRIDSRKRPSNHCTRLIIADSKGFVVGSSSNTGRSRRINHAADKPSMSSPPLRVTYRCKIDIGLRIGSSDSVVCDQSGIYIRNQSRFLWRASSLARRLEERKDHQVSQVRRRSRDHCKGIARCTAGYQKPRPQHALRTETHGGVNGRGSCAGSKAHSSSNARVTGTYSIERSSGNK